MKLFDIVEESDRLDQHLALNVLSIEDMLNAGELERLHGYIDTSIEQINILNLLNFSMEVSNEQHAATLARIEQVASVFGITNMEISSEGILSTIATVIAKLIKTIQSWIIKAGKFIKKMVMIVINGIRKAYTNTKEYFSPSKIVSDAVKTATSSASFVETVGKSLSEQVATSGLTDKALANIENEILDISYMDDDLDGTTQKVLNKVIDITEQIDNNRKKQELVKLESLRKASESGVTEVMKVSAKLDDARNAKIDKYISKHGLYMWESPINSVDHVEGKPKVLVNNLNAGISRYINNTVELAKKYADTIYAKVYNEVNAANTARWLNESNDNRLGVNTIEGRTDIYFNKQPYSIAIKSHDNKVVVSGQANQNIPLYTIATRHVPHTNDEPSIAGLGYSYPTTPSPEKTYDINSLMDAMEVVDVSENIIRKRHGVDTNGELSNSDISDIDGVYLLYTLSCIKLETEIGMSVLRNSSVLVELHNLYMDIK